MEGGKKGNKTRRKEAGREAKGGAPAFLLLHFVPPFTHMHPIPKGDREGLRRKKKEGGKERVRFLSVPPTPPLHPSRRPFLVTKKHYQDERKRPITERKEKFAPAFTLQIHSKGRAPALVTRVV